MGAQHCNISGHIFLKGDPGVDVGIRRFVELVYVIGDPQLLVGAPTKLELPIDFVLAAPQPTKSFDERSLKIRTITNKINKNTGLFSFSLMAHQTPQAAFSFFGLFRAPQGQQGSDTFRNCPSGPYIYIAHVPPVISASNGPSGQKSPDFSQPVAMPHSHHPEKRFGYIYQAPCALIK
jgi:hypothetical protein